MGPPTPPEGTAPPPYSVAISQTSPQDVSSEGKSYKIMKKEDYSQSDDGNDDLGTQSQPLLNDDVETARAWSSEPPKDASCKRKRIKKAILWLIAIGVLLALVISLILPSKPTQKQLQQQPTKGEASTIPKAYLMDCSSKLKTESFEFGNANGFAFLEKWEGLHGLKRVQADGEVLLRPSSDVKKSTIKVDVQWCFEEDEPFQLTKTSRVENGLKIEVPSTVSGTPFSHTWISVHVDIWINPEQDLDELNLKTDFMDIIMVDQFSLKANKFQADSVSGNIVSRQLDSSLLSSREIHLKSVSGNIVGHWPLQDVLSAAAISGSILLSFTPAKASPSNNAAVLDLRTVSGSISAKPHTQPSASNIPDRLYSNKVQSVSGSIKTTLLQTHKTHLSTSSGTTNLELYPLHASNKSEISVKSVAGSTALTLHGSLLDKDVAMKDISADIHGNSGSLDIQFPTQWQGSVDGHAGSGRIDVEWSGLEIDGGDVEHRIKAHKGNGRGLLRFRGTAGSVRLRG